MTSRAQVALLTAAMATMPCAAMWVVTSAARAADPGARVPEPPAPLRVGSKAFTESVILGEIITLNARATGAPVEHRAALGGTRLCWKALLAGEIDVYPDYTGTIIAEILPGLAPLGARGQDGGAAPTPARERADVRAVLRSHGVGMSDGLGFDNTYALGMRHAVAARSGIRTISDLRAHPQLRFAFSNEFINRHDGWPGLAARYQLAPTAQVRGLDHDLAYRGLAAGDIDVTDLYATDAEIRRYDLQVLTDDRAFFPSYEAVFLYRLDVEARWPAALAACRTLQGRVDTAAMMTLNARAKIDRVSERQVAADFVARAQPPQTDPARWRTKERYAEGRLGAVARRTREHVTLVIISLLAAVVLAIPLGILASRRPRVGHAVLTVVGLIQTIPSLALLVFMIPLLGIGTLPALAALFLYSLLPIVRNTHAGLAQIPISIRDAADALGLSRRAILWQVELPLAAGTILAGIKSAAVINVGTATLGALIGAGGFGQPIFTGIRLDDVSLILEGAVPASLLALGAQALFDLVERVVVPRPLRQPRRLSPRQD